MERDYLSPPIKELPLHSALVTALETEGFSLFQIQNRRMRMAPVRRRIWHYLYNHTNASIGEIARITGDFHPTTVSAGIDKREWELKRMKAGV